MPLEPLERGQQPQLQPLEQLLLLLGLLVVPQLRVRPLQLAPLQLQVLQRLRELQQLQVLLLLEGHPVHLALVEQARRRCQQLREQLRERQRELLQGQLQDSLLQCLVDRYMLDSQLSLLQLLCCC